MSTITHARLDPGPLPRAVHSLEPAFPADTDFAVLYGKAWPGDFAAVPSDLIDSVGRGWTWDGSAFAAPPALTQAEIAAVKDGIKLTVDADAEALRLTLITPGSGQAMEYQDAYAEAVQAEQVLKSDPAAKLDPADFPMLAATPGTDLAGAARGVLAAYDAYKVAGAAIRGARLKGKAAIDAATTVEAAAAAYAAIVWPKFG